MLRRSCFALTAIVGVALLAGPAFAAEAAAGLKQGTPELKSVGPLAFAPQGILLVADPIGAAIFAIDTGDRTPSPAGPFKVQAIDEKIASLLGTDAKQIQLNDLAVNPASGNLYVSVSRGRGPGATPVLIRADREGNLKEVPLANVKFAKAQLPNAPAAGTKNKRGELVRQESITSLAHVDGKVIVAGLSNEEFASNLRIIPFPFTAAGKGTSVEIYHGAHGRFETNAPVRTFVPYEINGQAHLLAAYTCTPLVKFPLSDLKPGAKIRGTTVAELGNGNRPLDMIVYQKDGKDYLLMANSRHGILKVPTENVDKVEGIIKPIKGTAGLAAQKIEDLKGVLQLDKLDKNNALVLLRTEGGSLNVDTVPLP